MTTWQHHVDYVKARGTCDEVMIVSVDNGTHFASAPEDFKLREYKAMIMDETTYEDKEETVNEATNLVNIIKKKASGKGGSGAGAQGLRLNSGKKHMLIRTFQDDTSKQGIVYGKIPKGGCCVAEAGRVILIGTFNEGKGQTASDCNDTIELYARYLSTSIWPDGSEGTAQSTPEQAKLTWQPFIDLLMVGKGDVDQYALFAAKPTVFSYANGAVNTNSADVKFSFSSTRQKSHKRTAQTNWTSIDEASALVRLMNDCMAPALLAASV